MVDFFELLKTRRSIRWFKDEEVETGLIREVISDSCLAPSASNEQPWKFIIINNKEMIKRLSDESKHTLLTGIKNAPDSPASKYEETLKNDAFNVL